MTQQDVCIFATSLISWLVILVIRLASCWLTKRICWSILAVSYRIIVWQLDWLSFPPAYLSKKAHWGMLWQRERRKNRGTQFLRFWPESWCTVSLSAPFCWPDQVTKLIRLKGWGSHLSMTGAHEVTSRAGGCRRARKWGPRRSQFTTERSQPKTVTSSFFRNDLFGYLDTWMVYQKGS